MPTLPTYEPKPMDAYPLPTVDGAYWAWSSSLGKWTLVEVNGEYGEIHGIQDALIRFRYNRQITAWVGPLKRPDGPPAM